MSSWLLFARIFVTSLFLVSELIFINVLRSGVAIKFVVSWILFSIFVAFAMGEAAVTKPVKLGILFSISVILVL